MSTAGTVLVVPAYLTWVDGGGNMGQFKCFVKSEDYDFGADVSEHPIEKGSNITDNVRVNTDECSIMFFETDSPLDDNQWTTVSKGTQILSIPAGVPQFTQPFGALQPPPLFEAWDNLITEKAIAIEAGGLVGNAAGGATGGAIGALAVGIAGEFVSGVPVPLPFPPGLQPPAPPVPTTQSYSVTAFQYVPNGTEPALSSEDGTPIDLTGLSAFAPPTLSYTARTIALLRELIGESGNQGPQVMKLISPYLEIDNVVITKIHVHRDADTGRAAEIQVDLKQIRYVTTTEVAAPAPAVVRTTPPVNKGEQNAGAAKPDSDLYAILNYIKPGLLAPR